MPYDARSMATQLVRKLNAVEDPGGKHVRYKVYYENQLIACTHMSHGDSEIADNIASLMAKQLCITLGVLDGIYRCPYGWKEYQDNYDSNRNPRIPYRVPWD